MYSILTEEDPMALIARNAINMFALTDKAQQVLPTHVIKNEMM